MTGADARPTEPEGHEAGHARTSPAWAPASTELRSARDLDRLADLVATGEIEVPGGLAPDVEDRLVAMIRHRLRSRLVRFIARQIALDIHREAGDGDQ